MQTSPVVELAWQIASVETAAAKQELIDPEQFLAALTKLRHFPLAELAKEEQFRGADLAGLQFEFELPAKVLQEMKIDPDVFRRELRTRIRAGVHERDRAAPIHRSSRSRDLFARAETVARDMGSVMLNPGHLLIAMVQERDSLACRLLVEKGADLDKLARRTRQYLEQSGVRGTAGGAKAGRQVDQGSETPFLDRFGIDLTEEARQGRLGPVIGRRKEILQIIRTLARRSKNNPVLVGQAGVGKTAIVEALAIRAIQGKDQQVLKDRRIVALNMTTVVGGAMFRGEFEQRFSNVITECAAHREVILFIDELHTVIGAGKAEGGMDAANILKPALAQGDVRCIGATTIAEYSRYVESDSALERRFEKVLVAEPTRDETLHILQGLRPKLEDHHRTCISDAALEASIDLSTRFDCDRQLPDKAIDLLDLAGARVQVPSLSVKLAPDDTANAGQLGPIEQEHSGSEVTEHTVAEVLAERLGVPVNVMSGHLAGGDRSRLLQMGQFLKDRLIGQDNAIQRVCKRLLLAHEALNERRGPVGVFLFLGPTGVGKTEMARSMALFLFGSEREMIRLDMSEYMEEHSVAKLIGSPPGYIGHEEQGQLTGKLRARPYSIVLLDEVEKAHPRVFDLFLQVFDDGRLTDSKGRTADARHAIFVMTSNIPADRNFGFRHKDTDESCSAVLQEVERRFRREFINRIDEHIVFRLLSLADVKIILDRRLDQIAAAFMRKYSRAVEFTKEARDLVASKGYDPEYGVRNLYRTIQDDVEAPLTHLIASGRMESERWPCVVVSVQDGRIALTTQDATL